MALLDSTDTSQSAPTVFTGAHGRPDSRADRLPLFGLKMPEQRYFASVQGMRGISALSVLVVHIYLMALHGGFFPPVPAWVAAALSTFGNGVALFFIISGFVIPASLFRHGNVTRFMIDRVLRIMPVFLAIHFLVFALGPLIGYKWLEGIGAAEYWKLFLTNMTFTALPLGLPLAQQNSWTLTYEWGFYLLVSLMWALLFLTNRRWLMGVVIVATAVGICIAFPVCIYFVIGLWFVFYPIKTRISRAAECVIVPLCLFAFFYGAEFVGFAPAAIPAIVLFRAVLQDGSFTSKFLEIPFLQYAGKTSYSIYLLHPLAMFPLQQAGALLIRKGWGAYTLLCAFAICGVVATFVSSSLSYKWLEVWLRGWLARQFVPAGLIKTARP